ncbi:MAG: VCBS repeat-containing protein [Acidobacteria bacterium]|nr:VCBS repeat-containing protein [Acidobacteriota bacterium]
MRRFVEALLLGGLVYLVSSTGCGLILDLDPPDMPPPLPAAFTGGCFERFDANPGVIFFDGGGAMVAGRGRGLFVAPDSRWTFVESSRSGSTATLTVSLADGSSAEIGATALGDDTMQLTGLPGSPTDLVAPPCLDTVGLYDASTQTFSLWNAHLDDPPDPGLIFPFEPSPIDPANLPSPVAGDWDGDGTDEVGVWDPVQRVFFLGVSARRVTFPPGTLPPVSSTPEALLPIAGDWDGDGTDEVGVMATETGDFFLLDSLAGTSVNTFRLGDGRAMAPGDRRPVAGDWDGDGDDSVGIFNQRVGRLRLINENRAGMTEITCLDTGLMSGLRPVAGRWGDIGRERVLLYNPLPPGTATPLSREFLLVEVEATCRRVSRFAIGPTAEAGNPLYPFAGNWDGR